jgi:hypothetical protein
MVASSASLGVQAFGDFPAVARVFGTLKPAEVFFGSDSHRFHTIVLHPDLGRGCRCPTWLLSIPSVQALWRLQLRLDKRKRPRAARELDRVGHRT